MAPQEDWKFKFKGNFCILLFFFLCDVQSFIIKSPVQYSFLYPALNSRNRLELVKSNAHLPSSITSSLLTSSSSSTLLSTENVNTIDKATVDLMTKLPEIQSNSDGAIDIITNNGDVQNSFLSTLGSLPLLSNPLFYGGTLAISLIGYKVYTYFRLQYIMASMLGKWCQEGSVVEVAPTNQARTLYYYPQKVNRVIIPGGSNDKEKLEKTRKVYRALSSQVGSSAKLNTNKVTEVVPYNLEDLDYKAGTIDNIVSINALGKRTAHIEKVMKKINRLLKDGGRFIFIEPTESLGSQGEDLIALMRGGNEIKEYSDMTDEEVKEKSSNDNSNNNDTNKSTEKKIRTINEMENWSDIFYDKESFGLENYTIGVAMKKTLSSEEAEALEPFKEKKEKQKKRKSKSGFVSKNESSIVSRN